MSSLRKKLRKSSHRKRDKHQPNTAKSTKHSSNKSVVSFPSYIKLDNVFVLIYFLANSLPELDKLETKSFSEYQNYKPPTSSSKSTPQPRAPPSYSPKRQSNSLFAFHQYNNYLTVCRLCQEPQFRARNILQQTQEQIQDEGLVVQDANTRFYTNRYNTLLAHQHKHSLITLQIDLAISKTCFFVLYCKINRTEAHYQN